MEEKDKIRARLEKMSKELRQRAIEMEEAVTISRNIKLKDIEAQKRLIVETEEKLSYYKYVLDRMLEERWGESQRRKKAEAQAPKERVFAQASTGDEAEGDVPSPEERSFALNGKTKEEILESGTLTEKIRLFLCYKDDNGYADSKARLTNEEVKLIIHSINTKEDRDKAAKFSKEYEGLCKYGEQLRFYFKRFQTCFSALAKVLNEWDSYEITAQIQTAQIRAIIDMPTAEEAGGIPNYFDSEEQKQSVITNIVERVESIQLNGAALKWDGRKNLFKVEVYKTGLYGAALKEAKETAEAMADFKALAVAAEEFIAQSELGYTPISIQLPIQNAKEERYTRYLVKNLRFFRSELKPSHTSEQAQRALIPDFYQTKPNREFLRDARAALQSYVK